MGESNDTFGLRIEGVRGKECESYKKKIDEDCDRFIYGAQTVVWYEGVKSRKRL